MGQCYLLGAGTVGIIGGGDYYRRNNLYYLEVVEVPYHVITQAI